MNLVVGNLQLQDEYLCHFHFESLGLMFEMTIIPLEWVLGHDMNTLM